MKLSKMKLSKTLAAASMGTTLKAFSAVSASAELHVAEMFAKGAAPGSAKATSPFPAPHLRHRCRLVSPDQRLPRRCR
jgi:hypothetical protein